MYQGIAKWPVKSPERFLRIDIKAWHWSQRGAALIAFTGNQRFNRAIRRYAEALGFHLNDKCLCIAAGSLHSHPFESSSEEAIFDHLGLEWRSPPERLMFYSDG